MKVTNILCTFLFCCSIWYTEAKIAPLFFPEDIQTILNIAYSRLPPVKVGSDQRFGVGFKMGRNADFQMLFELGPQSETAQLADPINNSFGKRESYNYVYDRPKSPGKTATHKPTGKGSSHYKNESPSLNTVNKNSYSVLQKDQNINSMQNNNNKPQNQMKTSTPKHLSHSKSKPSTNKQTLQNQTKTSINKPQMIQSQLHNSTNNLSTTNEKASTNKIQNIMKTSNSKPVMQNKEETLSFKFMTKDQENTVINKFMTKNMSKVSTTKLTPLNDINLKSSTNNVVSKDQVKTTKNQEKTTTNKPVSETVKTTMKTQINLNIPYKPSENIFDRFINWLSRIAFA